MTDVPNATVIILGGAFLRALPVLAILVWGQLKVRAAKALDPEVSRSAQMGLSLLIARQLFESAAEAFSQYHMLVLREDVREFKNQMIAFGFVKIALGFALFAAGIVFLVKAVLASKAAPSN